MATMTDEQWVEYYLKHPDDLLAFIKTANEQANRMADRINELEAAECAHLRTLTMPSGKLFCVVCQEYVG